MLTLSLSLCIRCGASTVQLRVGWQRPGVGVQDVREGEAITKRFHSIMQSLVDGMHSERPAESSIAAHLLDIKDPETGAQT